MATVRNFRAGVIAEPPSRWRSRSGLRGRRSFVDEEGTLVDMGAKLAYTVARFSTDWVAKQLRLSMTLAADLLEQLCREGLVEETLRTAAGRSHYRITQRGREYAARALEVCGYIGP